MHHASGLVIMSHVFMFSQPQKGKERDMFLATLAA